MWLAGSSSGVVAGLSIPKCRVMPTPVSQQRGCNTAFFPHPPQEERRSLRDLPAQLFGVVLEASRVLPSHPSMSG